MLLNLFLEMIFNKKKEWKKKGVELYTHLGEGFW